MEGISDTQTKIWVCSRCRSVFFSRWLLSRHLNQVHKAKAEDASNEAMLSEWWRVYNPELIKIQNTCQPK